MVVQDGSTNCKNFKKINHSQNKTLIVGTLLPTSICPYHFFLLSDRDILIPAVRNTLRALFWLCIYLTLVFEVCSALWLESESEVAELLVNGSVK